MGPTEKVGLSLNTTTTTTTTKQQQQQQHSRFV
jgi:hypothetical protein